MESHTWHHFFAVLAWIIADANVARHTLDHAADELEGAADATGDAPVRRFLRRHVLDTARDRVAALRSWEPRPVAAAAALPLRPNRGLLVNVKRGIDLLLGSEPSAVVMRSFPLRDPRQRSRHEWYPAWLAGVQSAVDNAVRRLSRARSDMEAVCSDVDAFLAMPTPAHSAQACAAAARHARSAVANLGALVHILRVLEDEVEDEPPTARVVQFFGYSVPPPLPPPAPANGSGPAGGAAAAAAAGDAA